MDESTDDARPPDETQPGAPNVEDQARPDQLESEMLFGETIAWMRPNAPLFRPDPDLLPETTSEPDVAEPVTAAPVLDQFALPPTALGGGDESPGRDRRKILLLIAGGLAVVLAGVAAFAIFGGGDDADVSTAAGPTTTNVAPTTTTAAPSTIPPEQGTEKQTSQGTSVTVKSDVLFDVNSSTLTAEASSRLGAFLTLAARDPGRRLLVEGFTDSDGDAGFNQQLSEARAQSVAHWLIGQGIDPGRITAVGHGAESPVAPNDTPENKALNRRVVVTLLNAGA
jgi:outer membrane protein OmpA-like peptidoglycan-associated protein